MLKYALILCPTLLFAGGHEATPCNGVNDWWEITDVGYGEAIVTYYNSEHLCSDNIYTLLVSPAGIEVMIEITTGVDDEDRERVRITPTDICMQAIPEYADLLDGETVEIVVMGGCS